MLDWIGTIVLRLAQAWSIVATLAFSVLVAVLLYLSVKHRLWRRNTAEVLGELAAYYRRNDAEPMPDSALAAQVRAAEAHLREAEQRLTALRAQQRLGNERAASRPELGSEEHEPSCIWCANEPCTCAEDAPAIEAVAREAVWRWGNAAPGTLGPGRAAIRAIELLESGECARSRMEAVAERGAEGVRAEMEKVLGRPVAKDAAALFEAFEEIRRIHPNWPGS